METEENKRNKKDARSAKHMTSGCCTSNSVGIRISKTATGVLTIYTMPCSTEGTGKRLPGCLKIRLRSRSMKHNMPTSLYITGHSGRKRSPESWSWCICDSSNAEIAMIAGSCRMGHLGDPCKRLTAHGRLCTCVRHCGLW